MNTSTEIVRISRNLRAVLQAAVLGGAAAWAGAAGHVLSVHGAELRLDGKAVKLLGLRVSNATLSEGTTQELIDHLAEFQSCGVNAISVYVMGSRFSDIKGYRPDASLDPVHAGRLERIIRAADDRGMTVLVGCLYWSESEAKADLAHWTQHEADLAVANTVRWLKEKGFRNVIVDPDNEGMAFKEKGWDIGRMIAAAHGANPDCVVAYNARPPAPPGADLTIHHASQVAGKPHVETEGTPEVVPYWHEYSRKAGYRNYLNVGIYTPAMKEETFSDTREMMTRANGFLLASTWLQALPPHGPNCRPGGEGSPDQPGVRWWLDFIRSEYGPGIASAAELQAGGPAAGGGRRSE